MKVFTQWNTFSSDLTRHFNLVQELISDHLQGVFWPGLKNTPKHSVKACLIMRFWSDFCRTLQCNFCRESKLAEISVRFGCDICWDLLWFPENRRQLCIRFQSVQNICDIAWQIATNSHWNRHLFIHVIHLTRGQIFIEKRLKSCAQKIACVNGGPLATVFTQW